jgi:hypothetical protein
VPTADVEIVRPTPDALLVNAIKSPASHRATVFLLACGILSPLLYDGTDILASMSYSGYSYRDQAVSELFAIGAPTSGLVVPLFTLSSIALVLLSPRARDRFACLRSRCVAVRLLPSSSGMRSRCTCAGANER